MTKAQRSRLASVRVVALLSLPPLHVTHTPHEETMMTPSLSDALDTIDAKNKRIAELEAALGAAGGFKDRSPCLTCGPFANRAC